MEKIKVRNLSKEFTVHTRGGIKIQGYEHINFEVKKAEFLSLYGPSGMGKSSILKALFRTYTTTGGEIIFTKEDGKSVNIATCDESTMLDLRKNEIGYVSQFLKVLPRIGAVDVVAAPLIDKGEDERKAKEVAKELLSYLGIKEELFNVSPLTFSGGEQQRVNIAKGIIAPKSVLLLDEPTASLDHSNTMKVIQRLQKIKAEGVAMIGIFHDMEAMRAISDTVYDLQSKNYVEI
ncbi:MULTISPECIES: phosphonate C-P lyase system protein PhnL [unclassified Sulfurospirillum]|uniref:phosphonate C-P lyase system protein PhnL n=1 Tax=unclassified Sulfurospirillum TaxID=2618290 RepID=UPI0005008493|nr:MULTISPECIES: phosphonate C-P lyase system protein PhnL [unclassified Sulfurospirillum]KFL35192.1 phosphonate ABC transporter ATP-binding protein [Sulfurospirillum sp. SCADC]